MLTDKEFSNLTRFFKKWNGKYDTGALEEILTSLQGYVLREDGIEAFDRFATEYRAYLHKFKGDVHSAYIEMLKKYYKYIVQYVPSK